MTSLRKSRTGMTWPVLRASRRISPIVASTRTDGKTPTVAGSSSSPAKPTPPPLSDSDVARVVARVPQNSPVMFKTDNHQSVKCGFAPVALRGRHSACAPQSVATNASRRVAVVARPNAGGHPFATVQRRQTMTEFSFCRRRRCCPRKDVDLSGVRYVERTTITRGSLYRNAPRRRWIRPSLCATRGRIIPPGGLRLGGDPRKEGSGKGSGFRRGLPDKVACRSSH